MRNNTTLLFPILLLSALAGLTFWLQHASLVPLQQDDGKTRHDPDGIAEKFVVSQLNPQGILQYRLTGPAMRHYPDNDSAEVDSPFLVYFRPDQPNVEVRSEQADVTSKGETVFLRRNVKMTRLGTSDSLPMVATMPDFTAYPNAKTGKTDSPVLITQGASWLRGEGLDADTNTQIYILRSRVTGLLHNPNTTTATITTTTTSTP